MSFWQTLPLLSQKSKSSTQWISRQSRDPFVKKRVTDPAAYRARSAFKLLEMNDRQKMGGGFLDHDDVNAVVDLGAAPGGWSQVVARKFGWENVRTKESGRDSKAVELGEPENSFLTDNFALEVQDDLAVAPSLFSEDDTARRKKKKKERVRKAIQAELEHYDPLNIDDLPVEGASLTDLNRRGRGTIVAVDLLPIISIPGVKVIRGDFLHPSTTQLIQQALSVGGDNPSGKADVILSDMAANVSGNTAHDIQSSLEICLAVFEYAKWNLRSANSIGRKHGGVLLMKHFAHPLLDQFREENLVPHFHCIHNIKPESSRSSSRECYFLCQGWNPL